MTDRIIYQKRLGGVALITPAPGYDVHTVAWQTVPRGRVYWVVAASALPALEYFGAWELDRQALGAAHGTGEGAGND
jgi:hypothetical protein